MTAINSGILQRTQEKGEALDGLGKIQRETGELQLGGLAVHSGDRVSSLSFSFLLKAHRSLERERVKHSWVKKC